MIFEPTDYVKNLSKINYLERIKNIDLMDIKKYNSLYESNLVPTSIKFDIDLFEKTMKKYSSYFKIWSNNRPEVMYSRLGIPLVNLSGRIDDKFDLTIGPLDYYNKNNPGYELWESDIKTPTDLLAEKCFDVLNPIKPYMLRSSILKWHPGGNFLPHIDTVVPSPWFRFWGTNNTNNIKLRFYESTDQSSCVVEENVEAGRLYLINTAKLHDALCINDVGYQFFICVNNDCYDTAKGLKIKL